MKPISSVQFTKHDLERIQQAVGRVEGQTSGEVVPYVVNQSDEYDEAELRGAILFSLLPMIVFVFARFATDFWIDWEPLTLVLLVLVCMAGGWVLAGKLAPLKRWLAGKSLLQRRSEQRAEEAFLSEEVFKTRDRTGILLFVSMFEHQVMVIGDSGINALVQQSEWEAVVRHVVDGIRSGRRADAIIEGVDMCAAILSRKNLPRRPDDTNELPDTVRTGM